MTRIRLRMLAATLALVLIAAVTVAAHMAYSKSVPGKDAALAESPAQLRVWFTQDPEPALSQLSLESPDGEVAIGKTTVSEERSVVAEVPSTLGPGSYTVKWRSAGDDGHVQRGDFAFTIRAAD